MAKGDSAARALLARIRTSEQSLVLNFPDARPAPEVSGPSALPASPLTGFRPAPTLVPPTPNPEREPLTLKCLWLDSPLAEAATGVTPPPITQGTVGWIDGAAALARVSWSDAQVDPNDPAAGTWFDKALNVEFRGLTWRVLKTAPMGASFRAPHSLSVWLVGADKT